MDRFKNTPSPINDSLYARDNEENVMLPKSMILELVHEVRNPLTLIKSTVQLAKLKKKPIDLEHGENILKEVDRITRILEEFVTLARSEKYQERINLNQLLKEISQLMEGEARLNSIVLDNQLSSEEILVLGHRDQFKQVLINLSRNSMDAMENGGILTYSLCKASDEIAEIQIRDTGTGIKPEIIDSIFEPYFTTKEKGTGLGLAISKRIIQGHSGEITVENNADGGCKFHIIFPLA
ncbi:MAG: hypothetical protein KAX49_09320 [Halanaerobiales bacterium]|nr:hypothetical protein [Halanaerobiales bacterium]